MISNSTSDLGSNMRLSTRGIELRSALDKASMEVATGQKSDLAAATQGAVDTIFAIDKRLGNLDVFTNSIDISNARSSIAQNSLDQVDQALGEISVDVLAALERDDLRSARIFTQQSSVLLNSVVGALNIQIGGQSLFAGAAFDSPALAPAEQIMSDVQAIFAAAPDVTTAKNDLNTYFNDPLGGFATSTYQGSTVDAPKLSIGDGVDLNPFLRADNQALRDAVRIVATSAAIAEGAFAGDEDAQKAILTAVSQDSIVTRDEITYLRQDLGHAQSVIADTAADNAAERSALEMVRNDLTTVDPYKAATRVTELQTQLESLYLLTARLSGLSLANYLR